MQTRLLNLFIELALYWEEEAKKEKQISFNLAEEINELDDFSVTYLEHINKGKKH